MQVEIIYYIFHLPSSSLRVERKDSGMKLRQICVQISVLLLLKVEYQYSGAHVRPIASSPGLEHVDGAKPHSPHLKNGVLLRKLKHMPCAE